MDFRQHLTTEVSVPQLDPARGSYANLRTPDILLGWAPSLDKTGTLQEMRTCFLHIGSGKTGTSTLQAWLANNRDALLEMGIRYPLEEENHHRLATKFLQKDELPRQFNRFSDTKLNAMRDKVEKALTRELKRTEEDVVLSSEYLFRSAGTAKKVEGYLTQFFDRVEVVAVIRRPDQHFASSMQQMIKARSYIADPRVFNRGVRAVLQSYREVFGTGAVHILKFDEKDDIRDIFSELTGIEQSRLAKVNSKNTSLSVEQMLLLEELQSILYKEHEDVFHPHLGIVMGVSDKTHHKPVLKEEIASLILTEHEAETNWLQSSCAQDFRDWLPGSPTRAVPDLPESPTIRDVFEVDLVTYQRYRAGLLDQLLQKVYKAVKRSQAREAG